MKKIFGANWKLNPAGSESETPVEAAIKLIDDYAAHGLANLTDRELVVFVPVPLLPAVSEHVKQKDYRFRLGVQNVSEHLSGAHTGQVSAPMVEMYGVTDVLIGHSERRLGYEEKVAFTHEHIFEDLEASGYDIPDQVKRRLLESVVAHTHEMHNRKILALLRRPDIRVIYCIGETAEEKSKGMTLSVIEHQIKVGLDNVPAENLDRLVLAYEPRWAIGGGAAPPELRMIEYMHEKIGEMVSGVPILYGGSLNASNAAEIVGLDVVGGGLIGGKSLSGEALAPIVLYDKG